MLVILTPLVIILMLSKANASIYNAGNAYDNASKATVLQVMLMLVMPNLMLITLMIIAGNARDANATVVKLMQVLMLI